MFEELKNIKSGKKELRDFGLVVGGAALVIGIFLWWYEREAYIWLLAGGILVSFGLLFPPILKPFQKIWMAFAVLMGWVMTRFILGVLFFAGLTGIRLIAKTFGRTFLDLDVQRNESTYWNRREEHTLDIKEYERQF